MSSDSIFMVAQKLNEPRQSYKQSSAWQRDITRVMNSPHIGFTS